jgi:hypothetical protein
MPRRPRILAAKGAFLLLLPVLLLAACGSGQSAQPATQSAQPATQSAQPATQSASLGPDCTTLVGKIGDIKASPNGTAGWKLSKLDDAGFQVAIPPGWNEVATVGSQRFRASDPSTPDMVSVDISVFPHQGKMPTLDALINQEGHNVVVNHADVLQPFQVRQVTLAAGSAGQLVVCRQILNNGTPTTYVFNQYFLQRKLSDREYSNYLIQFATTEKHWHDYAQVFHSIAETFRFLS